MKATVLRWVEVEITEIHVRLPVRFQEEDIPNDFPLRSGNVWSARIEIDTGRIIDWPDGKDAELYLKVCDEGVYELRNANGRVAILEGTYVPHGVIPGEYGDYVSLNIASDGVITNWPKRPDVSAFFGDTK